MDVGTQWGWWRRKILTGPIYPPTLHWGGGNGRFFTFRGKCHFCCLIHGILLKSLIMKIGQNNKNCENFFG